MAAVLVLAIGFAWTSIQSVMASGEPHALPESMDNVRPHWTERVTLSDKIVGLVLGLGSIYVIWGCWRLERSNSRKDATIRQLQEEIAELKGSTV